MTVFYSPSRGLLVWARGAVHAVELRAQVRALPQCRGAHIIVYEVRNVADVTGGGV